MLAGLVIASAQICTSSVEGTQTVVDSVQITKLTLPEKME